MTIEFQTPYRKVSEDLVDLISNELFELKHIQKKITRAEVILREDMRNLAGENKICEINLSIFHAGLFVYSCTESFERSANVALEDLQRLVKKQVAYKELPDLLLSSVKV